MLDLVAIAQSSPGAIAVNGAIVVGYKLAGIPGALVAILGTILPPFVIIAAISVCYNVFRSNFFVAQMLSGMQAGVGAVIASVTYDMGAPIVKEKDPMSLVIMLGAFLAACILEINVDHPAFITFETARITEPEKAKKYVEILYNQACLIAGLPIDDPSAYTDLLCSLWQ